MGRGRGKGKKVTAVPNPDDLVGGGNSVAVEAVVPTHKRRGRPTKPLKDDLDEEVAEKIEREEDDDDVKLDSLASKETTKAAAAVTTAATENGKKRRRHLVVKKEKLPPDAELHEENGDGGGEKRFRFLVDGAGKANGNGCRPHGNRRKSKPRRAAEVGVECRLD